MISHLFAQSDGIEIFTSGHLSPIGVYVPQRCVCVGLCFQTSEVVLSTLKDFVGSRPIVNAQGFSRPFVV